MSVSPIPAIAPTKMREVLRMISKPYTHATDTMVCRPHNSVSQGCCWHDRN